MREHHSLNIFTLPEVRQKKSDYKIKKNRSWGQGATNLSKLADHVRVTCCVLFIYILLFCGTVCSCFQEKKREKFLKNS